MLQSAKDEAFEDARPFFVISSNPIEQRALSELLESGPQQLEKDGKLHYYRAASYVAACQDVLNKYAKYHLRNS